MFKRVLIANRGAIATRIIKTLRELNIESVAIYAESDRESLHARNADHAFSLGEGNAKLTYLDVDKVLGIAQQAGVDAIHPGYGFLSENAEFAQRCANIGIAFIGPNANHITQFGLKHQARELAEAAGVPLLTGSGLLSTVEDALQFAEQIGYPVMLKSTAGGGGIGLTLCGDATELKSSYASVVRLSENNFSDGGVFIEKFIANARHIEVQGFGDGQGGAMAIGERDCSSQRRNQKVIEECPAPRLSESLRQALHQHSEALLASVNYANIGTIEFIVDDDDDSFYFLEVNTRLQVEHGVTEMVYQIDLVHWMLQEAWARFGDSDTSTKESENNVFALEDWRASLNPVGHAVQARVYAEDPYKQFQPSADLISEVVFPNGDGVRIDHWVEAGINVPDCFDPMLAKVIVHDSDRAKALAKLQQTLKNSRVSGCVTNLEYLAELSGDQTLLDAKVTTRYLNERTYKPCRIDVIRPGTQTTVQDVPGRVGYWDVGVPPSGAFDSLSFQLLNRLLGNEDQVAGLEITIDGPTLVFTSSTQVALGGAQADVQLNGEPVNYWETLNVEAGDELAIGRVIAEGARVYFAVRGGIQCPEYLGSRSTFTLGQFGGHNGRALRTGDVLLLQADLANVPSKTLLKEARPTMAKQWQLRVIYGPHGAPDFFQTEDIEDFFSTAWEVHYNSSRTGVRLIGPKPRWARDDGGDAGLHPSNIHDNAYAFGSVDFTGDMPVILGPDGPSLGGFVCPATVIQADLWKIGQLKSGDTLSFIPVTVAEASAAEAAQIVSVQSLTALTDLSPTAAAPTRKGSYLSPEASPIVHQLSAEEVGENVVYRVAGDRFLLVEYGDAVLDIALRFRVHALMLWLQDNGCTGLYELTPGIRSLQVHYNSQDLPLENLLNLLVRAEKAISEQLDTLTVPSRIVHLPLSWDDPVCQQAIDKYSQSVRDNAPWCPSNLEFIRRINGLDSIDDVKRILFDASYLVMGLGDVYLGAPVATPVNPAHRLVTTKYNPARTWTAENSVGIGGAYLCVYGMEGPGGYQFVGRTLQMWNRYRQTTTFEKPWLLRFFDQIRFYEVSTDELDTIRKDFPIDQFQLRVEESEFSLSDYQAMLQKQDKEVAAFREKRTRAFAEELHQWHANGQFNFEVNDADVIEVENTWAEDATVVDSSVAGSIWQVSVAVGERVKAGDPLMILESMKMEIALPAPVDGVVTQLLSESGSRVNAGQPLVVLETSS